MKKNLTNWAIISVVIFIISTAMLYGFAAFVANDANPANWIKESRLLVVGIDCFLIIASIAIPSAIFDNLPKEQ